MGFRPDDERLRDALDIAEREGLDYKFEKTTLATTRTRTQAHHARARRPPRDDDWFLTRRRTSARHRDRRYPVEVTGKLSHDRPRRRGCEGLLRAHATVLSEHSSHRERCASRESSRGGDAFMVIGDRTIIPGDESARRDPRLSWVRWAFRLDKVSA